MAEYRLAPTAEQWGIGQARRYLDMLTVAFVGLADAPKTWPSCDFIRPGYRRRGVERHVIYYRITGYGVEIMRILHDRMDSSRHL